MYDLITVSSRCHIALEHIWLDRSAVSSVTQSSCAPGHDSGSNHVHRQDSEGGHQGASLPLEGTALVQHARTHIHSRTQYENNPLLPRKRANVQKQTFPKLVPLSHTRMMEVKGDQSKLVRTFKVACMVRTDIHSSHHTINIRTQAHTRAHVYNKVNGG